MTIHDCNSGWCEMHRVSVHKYVDSWIAPDGTQYDVANTTHWHVAKHHFDVEPEVLERSGWLHFSLEYRLIIVNDDYRLTQAQRDVLFDIFISIPKCDSLSCYCNVHRDVLQRIVERD